MKQSIEVNFHDDGAFVAVAAENEMGEKRPLAYLFVARELFPHIEAAFREDRRRHTPKADPEDIHGDA